MSNQTAAPVKPAPLIVESTVLREGQPIPQEYTTDGRNLSPPLSWRNVPPAAKELVVAVEDLDFRTDIPAQRPMMHWVIYSIPPIARRLEEGFPTMEALTAPPELDGAYQAYTAFDRAGYQGPRPDPGERHRYRFSVYALDQPLGLESGRSARAVMEAIDGHVIAEGHLTVTYERKPAP